MAASKTTDQNAASTDAPFEIPPARRLRVNRVFQGARTGETPILTGTYYEDDPFLFGLAQWLCDEGYAEWLN